ncbi:MAG: DUF3592 domain-containing protein [Candidatus Kariarchaeaceae archaeon]|jgi:hypothetical protein
MLPETSCHGCGRLLPQKVGKCNHCGTVVGSSRPKTDFQEYEGEEESIDRDHKMVNAKTPLIAKILGSSMNMGILNFPILIGLIYIFIVYFDWLHPGFKILFFLLLGTLYTLVGDSFVHRHRDYVAKYTWIQTIGTIVESRVIKFIRLTDHEGRTFADPVFYLPSIGYTYYVYGKMYYTLNYSIDKDGAVSTWGYSSVQEAEKFLLKYPLDSQVIVYFDPNIKVTDNELYRRQWVPYDWDSVASIYEGIEKGDGHLERPNSTLGKGNVMVPLIIFTVLVYFYFILLLLPQL